MAILFRNTAVLTIGGMEARLTVYSGEGLIRAELAPFSSVTATVYTGALSAAVTYGGTTKTLTARTFTKPVSAVFEAEDSRKSLTLTASGIVYGGKASSSVTVSWKGDGSAGTPSLRISYASGLRQGKSSQIEWTVDGIPDGYRAYTIGVWMYRAPETKIEPEYTRSCLVDGKSAEFSLKHSLSNLEIGNILFYRIAVGLYRADGADSAGREDYDLYLETESPAYVCSGDDLYTLAPCDLRCSGIRRNRVVNVTWKLPSAATETAGFGLEYSYDGSSWVQLFWSAWTSMSYSFTLPADQNRVVFRIFAYSRRSRYEQSEYVYSPWLEAGRSNVYVGHNGGVVPAAEIYIGSAAASAVLQVG